MSDEKKPEAPVEESINNVAHIDDQRIERLRRQAPYFTLYDSFDLLRIKLLYGEPITTEEGIQLVTLTKYFMKYGHNEQIKIMAKHLHEKFIKKHGL